MDFTQLVQSLGTPLAILAVLALAAWRGMKWAAPLLEKLVSRHIDFTVNVEKTQQAQTVVMREQADNCTRQTELLKLMHEEIQTLKAAVLKRPAK